MRKSRYTEEQIVRILKRVRSRSGDGGTVPASTASASKRRDVLPLEGQVRGAWKWSEAQRLRQLEEENRKLEAASGGAGAGHRQVSRRCYQKSGKPAGQARGCAGVSRCSGVLGTACLWAVGSAAGDGFVIIRGRHACRSQQAAARCDCVNWPKIVAAGDTGGCTVLLRQEGWAVNSKQVYRIYVEEKLMVPQTQAQAAGSVLERGYCWQRRRRKNETWTMDFLQDARWPLDARSAHCRSRMPTRGRCWLLRPIPRLPALRVVRVLDKPPRTWICRCGSS